MSRGKAWAPPVHKSLKEKRILYEIKSTRVDFDISDPQITYDVLWATVNSTFSTKESKLNYKKSELIIMKGNELNI